MKNEVGGGPPFRGGARGRSNFALGQTNFLHFSLDLPFFKRKNVGVASCSVSLLDFLETTSFLLGFT